MALEPELIELEESDEVVDLTCESVEPVVIDLTCHDSVVITEQWRRPRRNTRSRQTQTGSRVVSSDGQWMSNRDMYVARSARRNYLEEGTASHLQPGYIQCRVCMDGYSEIELSRRRIYSTACGHIFCSRCLCTYLKYTKTCPVCLRKISQRQYHRIYI